MPISPGDQQFLAGQQTNLSAIETPAGLSREVSLALQQAIAVSFVDSFRVVMLIATELAIIAVLIRIEYSLNLRVLPLEQPKFKVYSTQTETAIPAPLWLR